MSGCIVEESAVEVVHVTVLHITIVQCILVHRDLQAWWGGGWFEQMLAQCEPMSSCNMEESAAEVVHVTVLNIVIMESILVRRNLQGLRVGQCLKFRLFG